MVALDIGVDTTTPNGELIANVMATFAQFERRLIGQRTKDALAVKQQQGVVLGVLGRCRRMCFAECEPCACVEARIVPLPMRSTLLARLQRRVDERGIPQQCARCFCRRS